MPAQSAPAEPLDRTPVSAVSRWAVKAAILGLFVGVAAGAAALLTG